MSQKETNSFIHDSLPQSVYDSFNEFIFSKDYKLFAKLASKLRFCELTKDIPGDIVELGVFKGSGLVSFLKANRLISTNFKKVYGFDIFDDEKLVQNISTNDGSLMSELFKKRNFDPKGYADLLREVIKNAGFNNFSIIVGSVFDTVPIFLNENPGFRASIINFDLDTSEPTKFCLNYFWDRLVKGGVMIFDEYAVNEWTESNAVDEFINERNLKLKSTCYPFPSAYLLK